MKRAFNELAGKGLKFYAGAGAMTFLVAAAMPAMGHSVDLKVEGTIIPAACTPSIVGKVDYDFITAEELSDKDFTVLDRKDVVFSIACTAPVKVGVKALNLRPGSVAGAEEKGPNNTASSPVELFGESDYVVAGLGNSEGDDIGGYAIGLVSDTLTVDGNRAFVKQHQMADVWVGDPVLWCLFTTGTIRRLMFDLFMGSDRH